MHIHSPATGEHSPSPGRTTTAIRLPPFLPPCLFVIVGLLPGSATAAETNLAPLVVTATRTPHTLEDVPVETVVLDRDALDRSGASNLASALGTVPGIATSQLDDVIGADNLRSTMRGLQINEGYGLVLVDGQRVHGNLGAHGDYGVSLNQIPLAMVERVEIVRGAGSALYGADAMAGVINIITRPVPSEPITTAGLGVGRYRMLDRDGDAPRDRNRTRMHVHAGHGRQVGARSGFYLHYNREEDEGNDREARRTTRDSFFGKWHTDFTGPLSLDLGASYSRGRREYADAPTRYDREYDSYRLSGRLTHDTELYSISAGGYTFRQDFTQGYPGFAHGYRHGEIGYDQGEVRLNRFGERNWLTVGMEVQRQHMDYVFFSFDEDGSAQPVVPVDESVYTYSTYIQNELTFFRGALVVVPGLRYESHSAFGGELNPKLSAMWRPGTDTTIRASVGRAFKSPTIRQLYYQGLYRHGDYYVESNPNLAPESAISGNLNLEQHLFDRKAWFSIGYFRTHVRDRVVRTESGRLADDGLPIQSFVNIDRALIDGVELAWRWELPRGFHLAGSADYTRAEDRETGDRLPHVPHYSASLAPEWRTGPFGLGGRISHYGKQYRNEANTQRVTSHTVVDLRVWHELSRQTRLTVTAGNIFASDRGDTFAWRTGRSVMMSLVMDL